MKARVRRYALFVAPVAVLLLLFGGVYGRKSAASGDDSPRAAVAGSPAAAVDPLVAAINADQRRLADVPGDYDTWAGLGLAYLERARVSADPAWYPKAEGALRKSLALRPEGNPTALIGLGALANARHDFAAARELARRAIAVDAYSADAYGVLADALTQLGQPAAATDAVQHMLDLHPGLAAYARASYDLEQHGRLDAATRLMTEALDAAADPGDIAFCRYQLGELAWLAGDVTGAAAQYAAGLAADPAYLPLAEGRAKVTAARGDVAQALAEYADLTARYPSPGYLIEYAQLLRAAGRSADAGAQLDLADAAEKLFAANGGTDDLGVATLALARGKPADAVAAARREWSRRHFADVADTLGWALHLTGHDRQALAYAEQARALGSASPRAAFHLGVIEAALGDTGAARAALTIAAAHPTFDPIDGPAAAAALARLGDTK